MSTDRAEDTSEVRVRPAGEGRGAATALSTDRAEDTSDVTDAYEPGNDAARPASEGREVAKA